MFAKWAVRPRRAIAAAVLISLCIVLYLAALSRRSLPSWVDIPLEQPLEQPSESDSGPVNATLIALVRNNEVHAMVESMVDLERTWNHKFNYPWIFFNDEPFDDEFKRLTQQATTSECRYELIPRDHWEPPPWIDPELFQKGLDNMEAQGVRYGSLASYRKMCRWNSGFFYKHRALADYRYYWRVEPGVHFFCDIDYDVFRFMRDNRKTYGFTITVYDDPKSIASLWPQTMEFTAQHPDYIHGNNSLPWLTASEGRPYDHPLKTGYSTCHFWSNFEIGDMEFFRGRIYDEYFNHLDRAGGFFYERWGDAPVHSVALGLFEDASKIHWFSDIGYQHDPYAYCPENCPGCYLDFTSVPMMNQVNCMPNWQKYNGKQHGGLSSSSGDSSSGDT